MCRLRCSDRLNTLPQSSCVHVNIFWPAAAGLLDTRRPRDRVCLAFPPAAAGVEEAGAAGAAGDALELSLLAEVEDDRVRGSPSSLPLLLLLAGGITAVGAAVKAAASIT